MSRNLLRAGAARQPPWDEALLRRVEAAAFAASASPHEDTLEGWVLRFDRSKAQRARCINPLHVSHQPLAVQLAECAERYAAHGLPMVVRITPFTQPEQMDAQLGALGWQQHDDSLVMVNTQVQRMPAWTQPAGIQALRVDHAHYAHTVGTLRGSSAAEIQAHAQRLQACAVAYEGTVWRRDGRVVACAQTAREGDVVGLYDVFTAPEARGQGLSRKLCASVLVQACAQGAQVAYLQVDAGNAAALAVYRHLGFEVAYGYHYRLPPH